MEKFIYKEGLPLPRNNIVGGLMNFNTPYSNPNNTNPVPERYDYSYLDPSAPSSPYFTSLIQPSDSYAVTGQDGSDEDHTGHLEAITDDILSKGASDPLSHFFTAKKRFLSKSVEDILGLIYEREEIKYDNLQKTDYDSCQLKTRLFEIDSWRAGINPQLDKTRGQIDRELMTLEREKRFENVACWRDTTRLKGELREALREFNQEKRKEGLLRNPGVG